MRRHHPARVILLAIISCHILPITWGNIFHHSDSFADSILSFQPAKSYHCVPGRIHISQATDVNAINNTVSMTVSFVLNSTECQQVEPIIFYGRGKHQEGQVTQAEKVTFDYVSPVTGENYTSGSIFHMVLPDVVAGLRKYWYQIVVRKVETLSSNIFDKRFPTSTAKPIGHTPKYSFRSPPLVGNPTGIALLGDFGQSSASLITMNHIRDAVRTFHEPISAILLAGDLSYANGEPQLWETWLDVMVS